MPKFAIYEFLSSNAGYHRSGIQYWILPVLYLCAVQRGFDYGWSLRTDLRYLLIDRPAVPKIGVWTAWVRANIWCYWICLIRVFLDWAVGLSFWLFSKSCQKTFFITAEFIGHVILGFFCSIIHPIFAVYISGADNHKYFAVAACPLRSLFNHSSSLSKCF